jgi:UDP-N-acetylmuramate dehydrogenase
VNDQAPSLALEEVARRLGPAVRRDVPLGAATTYGVGGAAALSITVDDDDALAALAAATAGTGVPLLVLGLGSNLLVADDGFPASWWSWAGGSRVSTSMGCGCGPVPAPSSRWWPARQPPPASPGFEWAAGVPGSVGGAVRMNAGVPDADMADALVQVRIVDLVTGADELVPAAHLALGYRASAVAAHQVVAWADLELRRGDPASARASIKEKTQWRRDHQPGGRNAGSVFTNPADDSAGRLIEAAGCKGLRIGTAEVSEKHANFILADEGGRAADVWALMVEVRNRVHAASGVDLHPETQLVGLPPLPAPSAPTPAP